MPTLKYEKRLTRIICKTSSKYGFQAIVPFILFHIHLYSKACFMEQEGGIENILYLHAWTINFDGDNTSFECNPENLFLYISFLNILYNLTSMAPKQSRRDLIFTYLHACSIKLENILCITNLSTSALVFRIIVLQYYSWNPFPFELTV